MVIADDPELAAEARSLIDVEYDPMPAYFDPESALASDAAAIHEGRPERDFVTYPDLVLAHDLGRNVINHFRIRRGDVEAGFARSDKVVEKTYRTPALQHASLEPHVAICQITGDHATVWSSASSPFTVRFQVAETLQIPQSKVRVIACNIGGAFGGKTYPRLEPLVAACSWRVGGRPVRIELDAGRGILHDHPSCGSRTSEDRRDERRHLRRPSRDDLLERRRLRRHRPAADQERRLRVGRPVRFDDVWVDSYAVYTNVPPAGGFRGYGITQVAWAYETQLDKIAERLGLDPLELRGATFCVTATRLDRGGDGRPPLPGAARHGRRRASAGIAGRSRRTPGSRARTGRGSDQQGHGHPVDVDRDAAPNDDGC